MKLFQADNQDAVVLDFSLVSSKTLQSQEQLETRFRKVWLCEYLPPSVGITALRTY